MQTPNGEYASAVVKDPAIGFDLMQDGIGYGWNFTNGWSIIADSAYQAEVGT